MIAVSSFASFAASNERGVTPLRCAIPYQLSSTTTVYAVPAQPVPGVGGVLVGVGALAPAGRQISSPGRITVESVASFAVSSARVPTPASCAMSNHVSPASTVSVAAPGEEHVLGRWSGAAPAGLDVATTLVAGSANMPAAANTLILFRTGGQGNPEQSLQAIARAAPEHRRAAARLVVVRPSARAVMLP
jgi:hypothetical protein